MNQIIIAGHLGADPEVRFTTSGQKVTTIRVATHSRKGGKDETIWYRVTIWGDRFDKMITYLKKGSAIIVTGELNKPEIYMDKEGKPQLSLEITAETLKFSPFGKPDKAQDQQSSGGHAPQDSSFEQQPAGATYGRPAASSYGQGAHAQDESEQLPF